MEEGLGWGVVRSLPYPCIEPRCEFAATPRELIDFCSHFVVPFCFHTCILSKSFETTNEYFDRSRPAPYPPHFPLPHSWEAVLPTVSVDHWPTFCFCGWTPSGPVQSKSSSHILRKHFILLSLLNLLF